MAKRSEYRKYVKLKIVNCKQCPNCKTKLTRGAGYATDYYCTAKSNRTIAGYVEWMSEEPQDGEIPAWCPMV